MAEQFWGIADIARDLDITPRTLRFYEDKGLIAPNRAGAARLYSSEDRVRLETILRAKRLGFTLDDIREVLEITDGKITDRAELLRRQNNFKHVMKRLSQQRRDLDIVRHDLGQVCDMIDVFVADPERDKGVFRHAAAYDAVLRRYLDEDDAPSHPTPQLRQQRAKV